MLELVITSGKAGKCHLSIMTTRPLPQTPALTTFIWLDPWLITHQPHYHGRGSICLFVIWYHIKKGIFYALILMESWMNTLCLEVRGLPEGTPRVQWDLWFYLSSQIYSHRQIRFITSPQLCVFEEHEDPTHERGELSPPPLYLCWNYSTFLLLVILMVNSSHLQTDPFSWIYPFQHHSFSFCSNSHGSRYCSSI